MTKKLILVVIVVVIMLAAASITCAQDSPPCWEKDGKKIFFIQGCDILNKTEEGIFKEDIIAIIKYLPQDSELRVNRMPTQDGKFFTYLSLSSTKSPESAFLAIGINEFKGNREEQFDEALHDLIKSLYK